ncbi:3-phosphoshikimate 1-carboxyvinyltransferase [Limnoglobus roseus]|uniref:3-phosphoshikimate 1-carboxyvinyltransferase n=1 Tax=Limnoglobus roseus TaxID=2598579 RepID=A0A5C1A5H8_9BACT|nr:3-phosphoshikimate 1-carboxyvinyltransferase [Limnoglobus roseus]QEL14399.1 3-phosphoshikimate 1-carboxyvinyltransferase [Limnoglobus roseus]
MSEFTYPAELPIVPMTKSPHATVSVPGSKSITNRAMVLAALASRSGPCELTGALRSEDTEVMVDCLTRLGFRVDADWPTVTVHANTSGRIIPAESAELFVANSGTTMRFVTAMVALGHGRYRLDGIPRMRERPIRDLLDALQQLGVDAVSDAGNGCPPVTITTTGLAGDTVRIRAGLSSQFLSGLMMAVPFADHPIAVQTDGPVVSEPYIEMTQHMLRQWGRHAPRYAIEPDASAASYFFAIPAILGGDIAVRGMRRDMLQGDVKFVEALEQMGCIVEHTPDGIRLAFDPTGRTLRGIDIDMNAISDTVMTLAVVALFADGPTTIRNVAHIRHKETDRIAAVATELRKLGAEVEERDDGLTIHPRPLTGCAVDTYNDHRMAMSLALVGLKVPGVVIRNPGCVAKTYPGFWHDLEKLRGPA